MEPLLPFLLAFTAALVLTPLVRAAARRFGMIAQPSGDRWHRQPTALMGGIAIYGGCVAGALAALWLTGNDPLVVFGAAKQSSVGILAAASLMFAVGLADDRFGLRPATKLILQGIAGATLVSFGVIYPVSPWFVANVLFTFFWFLALTNAFNLLDNMDGVAAGVAAISAVFLAVIFWLGGALMLSGLCLALAGALAGFLPYNFRPASIFMGDSGSLFIGSLLAGLGAAYPGAVSASIVAVLFVPMMIVIIPILDTLLVTVARTLAGRSIAVGGRDHTTHRLVAMGLSERQVALLLYAFAASGGVVALLLGRAPAEVGLSVGALFLAGLLTCAAYLGGLHTYPTGAPLRSSRVTVLLSTLLHKRRAFEVSVDLVMLGLAYQAAFLLRYDGALPGDQAALFERTVAIAIVAKLAAFGLMGVYRGHWSQLSLSDGHRLVRAALLGSVLTFAAIALLYPGAAVPGTILILDGLLVVLLAAGARFCFRSLDLVRYALAHARERVLIYGAGRTGELAVRELVSNPTLGMHPVGYLDDDPNKHGRLVHGYPVLGGLDQAREIVRRHAVTKVILCFHDADERRALRAQRAFAPLGAEVLQLRVELRAVRGAAAQAGTLQAPAALRQLGTVRGSALGD